MYYARQDLVHKGVLLPPGKPRFTRARFTAPELETQWRVQLPNGAAAGAANSEESCLAGPAGPRHPLQVPGCPTAVSAGDHPSSTA